jgi:hypothetical protein
MKSIHLAKNMVCWRDGVCVYMVKFDGMNL